MEQRTAVDISKINEKIERESAFIDILTAEMNKVIIGQKHMVNALLIGLLGKGHILLEGAFLGWLKPSLSIRWLSQYTALSVVYSSLPTCYLPMSLVQ